MASVYGLQGDLARKYAGDGQLECLMGWLRCWMDGRREGLAEAVLTVLEARGLAIPPDVHERVLGSTDPLELDLWLRRAAVIGEASALLDAPSP